MVKTNLFPVGLYKMKLFVVERPKIYQKLLQLSPLYAHGGVCVQIYNSTADYRLLWKNLQAENRIIFGCSSNDSENLLKTLINYKLKMQLNVSRIQIIQLCYSCVFANVYNLRNCY